MRPLRADVDELLTRAGSDEIKLALRAATDGAWERGVFGVPSMRVGGELFFGYDDLPFLERFLSGEDPLDTRSLPAWDAVRPSVVRRR